MNIFRGYTDGLAAGYQVATYQSGSFKRPARTTPEPRPTKEGRGGSFSKVISSLAGIVAKAFKSRGRASAPSDMSGDIGLFALPGKPQFS